tara:strand:- start:70 stop:318 length:249 start_codon:yes stop_codon:yes gene_type:complete
VRLIIKHNIQYTENKNGIFINISELDNVQLDTIFKFIELIQQEEYTFNQVEIAKVNLRKLITNKPYDDTSNETNDAVYSILT